MIDIFIDPWLVSPDKFDELLEALVVIDSLRAQYPDFSICASADPQLVFEDFANSNEGFRRSPAKGRMSQFYSAISVTAEPGVEQANAEPAFPGELPTMWLRALADSVRRSIEGGNWRSPVVLAPVARQSDWRQVDELKLIIASGACERVFCFLDKIDVHKHLIPDVDPWASERNRSSGVDCRRDLPRPRCVRRLRMFLWRDSLDRERVIRNCRGIPGLTFLPQANWNPMSITKVDWRKCPWGERQRLNNHGPGPKDCADRVWAWDLLHDDHWDVQCADGSHINVNPDGTVR